MLDQSDRQGSITSSEVVLTEDEDEVQVELDLPIAAKKDPGTRIVFHLERSEDSGQNWIHVAGGEYVGSDGVDRTDKFGNLNPNPKMRVQVPEFPENRFRMVYDIIRRVDCKVWMKAEGKEP